MPLAGDIIEAGRVPGWRIATTIAVAASSTFTAETVIMTVVAPVVAGRTYKPRAIFKLKSNIDNDDVTGRIREDNVTGTILQEDGMELTHDRQSSRGQGMILEGQYTAISTGNKTFVLTAERSDGTGNIALEATALKPSFLYIDYLSG